VANSAQQDPRIKSPFPTTKQFEPAAEAELESSSAPVNMVWAHAMLGILLGILFAVAITSPVRPADQNAAPATQAADVHGASVVQAAYVAPEVRDMGSVNANAQGLKGHLSTSWSEKLVYQLDMKPTEPGLRDAFAATVSNPPAPLSVNVELKSATGQVMCNQQVVLKYDPRKALKKNADFQRAEAQEMERESASDVFHNDLGKDGRIESISSQGTMPCAKADYDNTAYWSFSQQFPDLSERANSLAKSAPESKPAVKEAVLAATTVAKVTPAVPIVAKPAQDNKLVAELKVPAAPRAPAVARVKSQMAVSHADIPTRIESTEQLIATAQAPAPAFHYEIQGDDAIVDFDPAQKSLQTSARMTFYVEEAVVTREAENWMDQQVNVHYRCDETASCTLSLAGATVLHATRRMHVTTTAQNEMTTTVAAVPVQDTVAADAPAPATNQLFMLASMEQ
jgi:hypothetical protein